jgi:DNA invertase Pin-like site-specific DNA recombinase
MTKIAYHRTSTSEQLHDLQIDALKAAGCQKFFSDTASGSRADRPGLRAALDYARSGDVICVYRLDRLGRSLKHLLEVVEELNRRDIGLCSLSESLDTTSAGGRLVLQIFGAIAEMEREIIVARTRDGLLAARARGRTGGRPRVVDTAKARTIRALKASGASLAEIVESVGVSRATVVRFYREDAAKRALKEDI